MNDHFDGENVLFNVLLSFILSADPSAWQPEAAVSWESGKGRELYTHSDSNLQDFIENLMLFLTIRYLQSIWRNKKKNGE